MAGEDGCVRYVVVVSEIREPKSIADKTIGAELIAGTVRHCR